MRLIGRAALLCCSALVPPRAHAPECGATLERVQLLTHQPRQLPSLLREIVPTRGSGAEIGAARRASDVWSAIRTGHDPLTADSADRVGTTVRAALATACAPFGAGSVARETVASCGTRKLLVELSDGLHVEAVIIPMGRHSSLCVSSQVGCVRGCVFCATGAMGIKRSLSAAEILTQVWLALRAVREHSMPPLVNVVFMGMGEPLDNLRNVETAVRTLTDPAAFGFSPRTITVSTVGPSPAAIRAAASLPCKLAWSVHAAREELRRALVPTSAAHPLADTVRAFSSALETRADARLRGKLLIEAALIGGVNDGLQHAADLAELVHELGAPGVLVNLIPYNENPGLGPPDDATLRPGASSLLGSGPFRQPSLDAVRAFQRELWARGVRCTVRQPRGDEQSSACGQLATTAATAEVKSRGAPAHYAG